MSYPEEIMMNYQKRLKSINTASFSDFNPDEQSSFLIKGEAGEQSSFFIKGEADSETPQDQSNSKGRESVSSSDNLSCVLNIKHLTIEADTVTIHEVGSTSSADIQRSKIPRSERSARNIKSNPSTSSQSIQSKGSTNLDVGSLAIKETETSRQSHNSRNATDRKGKEGKKEKLVKKFLPDY